MRRAAGPLLFAALVACNRSPASTAQAASASASATASASSAAPEGAAPPLDARAAELWQRAEAGETDDLARLADYEGCAGLVERGRADEARRMTAIRAAAYCGGTDALPWLAERADDGDDGEAQAALESAADLAALPRRSADLDDATDLRDACDRLLALAKDTGRPKPRRAGAIRTLRMLVDRGCVARAAIPTDLDAK